MSNALLSSPLAYDRAGYVASLVHVGRPVQPDGLDLHLLARPITGSGLQDVTAAVPYSAALAEAEPARLRNWLDRNGFVTFVGIVPPGTGLDQPAWRAAGFEVVPWKPCYLHTPEKPRAEFRARTRRNLRLAFRTWRVWPISPRACVEEALRWYGELLARRPVHPMLHYGPVHFEALAEVEGMGALGAHDGLGLGAVLLFAETAAEIHFHIAVGDRRAYRTAGFYGLFQGAVDRFGSRRRLLFTGAPGGAAQGLARFKERFSNEISDLMLIRAILRPEEEAFLRKRLGTYPWFPAYRPPAALPSCHD